MHANKNPSGPRAAGCAGWLIKREENCLVGCRSTRLLLLLAVGACVAATHGERDVDLSNDLGVVLYRSGKLGLGMAADTLGYLRARS